MTVRKGKWSKEPRKAMKTGGMSVNADTDWKKVPECQLTGVVREIIAKILGLRAKFGTEKIILFQARDAKSVFRQVVIAPDWAVASAYRLDDLRFVDFRLPREPRMVGDGSESNPGSAPDDDVGAGG